MIRCLPAPFPTTAPNGAPVFDPSALRWIGALAGTQHGSPPAQTLPLHRGCCRAHYLLCRTVGFLLIGIAGLADGEFGLKVTRDAPVFATGSFACSCRSPAALLQVCVGKPAAPALHPVWAISINLGRRYAAVPGPVFVTRAVILAAVGIAAPVLQ
jgi:hypothetical protein